MTGTGGTGDSAKRLLQSGLKRAASLADRLRSPAPGVVALLYHRVGGTTAAREIDLPAALFDEQLGVLRARGTATDLDTALAALTSPAGEGGSRAPATVVTFDDGTADFFDVALPLLVEHEVPAVLYVATAFVEDQREFPAGGTPVSWAALRDAVATGLVTLGSHTHTHLLLDRADGPTAEAELDRSIELLRDRAGVDPLHFAYPKAVAPNPAAARAVRRRFRSAAVAGTRPNPYGSADPYRLFRSPVQTSDGMRWFLRKLDGGQRLEDDVRRLANRVRYAGAQS